MFFYRVRLFNLSGFDVYVDASWLLLAVFISWSLAVGIFPNIVAGLSSATYWSMAVVAFPAYSPWVSQFQRPSTQARPPEYCRQ
jgi:hypothetical protein